MIIHVLEVAISVLLILSILVQQRAAGLANSQGGMNTTVVKRRGAEKALYQASIVLSIAFFLVIILDWFV